jgi:hypothetical protein
VQVGWEFGEVDLKDAVVAEAKNRDWAVDCVTTIKASRRRQLKLASWDGGFLG